MENEDLKFITAQLVAIFKRLDDLERSVDGRGTRLADPQIYLRELNRDAQKIVGRITL